MRNARLALASTLAVIGAFPAGENRSPRNACRIVDPRFFRLRVAATCLTLLDHVAARLVQSGVNLFQFVPILDLNAEMIQSSLPTASRDSEIHAGIIEHPLRVIRLGDRRLR